MAPLYHEANILNFLKKFLPQKKVGEQLSHQLMKLQIETISFSNKIQLVQYKFFTGLVQNLIQSAILYGTTWQHQLPAIKQGLMQDIQLDQKIFSAFAQGLYQILIILMFTLGSCYLLESQLQVSLGTSEFLIPIALQVFGLFVYAFLYYQMRFKTFANWQIYLVKAYSMRTLCSAQIPLKLIHEKLQIEQLPSSKEFLFFKQRLIQFMELIKEQGRIETTDVDMLIAELWQMGLYKFEKFDKLLTAFKLMIICLFSLSGFLALFYQIFGKLSL
jgi:hypothetical protein